MNKKILITIAVVLVIAIGAVIGLLCANSGSDKADVKPDSVSSQQTDSTGSESAADVEKAPSENANSAEEQKAPENTKYGDAEIYDNTNGVPSAKTESGVEVELTGDNLQKLFAEYEKVKGSGSETEKALLDQIQLILETQELVN